MGGGWGEPRELWARGGRLVWRPNAVLTVARVFCGDTKNKRGEAMSHPGGTGGSVGRIPCVVDSRQLTDAGSVAPAASWHVGDDVVIVPSLQHSGSVEEKILEDINADRALSAHHAAVSHEVCQ